MFSPMDKIIHHGGATGVTGSCHEWFFSEDTSILIDCGLFQGNEAQNQDLNFGVEIERVKAIVLTHGHIDHIGRLPWLIAAGFRGPIICSIPTAKLLPLILEDALQIQIPGQDKLIISTISRIQKQLVELEYNQIHRLFNDSDPVTVTLQNAGHILGSAYVEIEYRQHVTVFSGDIGAPGSLLNVAPVSPNKANTLVLESTYGDKLHKNRSERVERLKEILTRSLSDGGPIIIPAFSLGRTQELLATIEEIKIEADMTGDVHEPWESQSLPVILDSPLASRITFAYRRLRPYWNSNLNSRNPFGFDSLATIQDHREHLAILNHLKSTGRPAIILAASGMCQGGRVMNYLKEFLPRDNTDIVFVGYQAEGTIGRKIMENRPGNWVELNNNSRQKSDNQKTRQNARIHQLSGFSAHADQKGLLEFVNNIAVAPSKIKLVHGSHASRNALQHILRNKFTNTEVLTD